MLEKLNYQMRKFSKFQQTSNNILNWLLQDKDASHSLPFYSTDMIFDHLILCFKE